ncbi:6-phosphogluconolactonase [Buchnera aphidicola (Rhopalosiphum padi)]|uniref:6-phosphogluconolactonase n=1 Tax=Buchnera aphidicola subsp. Rhopalosiphum padi TaxID=98793 RepID=A0A4D6Y6F1_BUCRP|nr:6-phosphogluconolactonase [Buchnera aphidicola]QCI24932.1 6-phosphogluconolactonase [Buchnera aphidicola (Rhopalosiphum padi)]
MKQIIYIANAISENIEVWNLYNNGDMELIQKVQTNGQVQPISIIKNKKLLYAGVRPNNRIITYCIDKNGLLEKKGEGIIPGTPNYISFDGSKKFLFCSSYHANCISVSPLDKNGVPKNPIQIVHNIEGCHASKFNNKYNALFVTSLKNDCIYLYYLTDFGILKSTEQKLVYSQTKSGPRHIVFHPNQNFSYTINELNGTVDVWKIYKENNILKVKNIQNTKLSNNLMEKKYWSSDIHITMCGNFLYVSDRFLNSISLFHINKNDNTVVFFKKYDTEEQPRSFCIDSNNSYLIVVGQKSNKLSLYRICQKTGELNKVNQYKTGEGPLWITSLVI